MLASLIDVMPTLANLAQVPDRASWNFLGTDLTPVLEPDGTLPEAIAPAAFAGKIKDELGQWKKIATDHKIVAE